MAELIGIEGGRKKRGPKAPEPEWVRLCCSECEFPLWQAEILEGSTAYRIVCAGCGCWVELAEPSGTGHSPEP